MTHEELIKEVRGLRAGIAMLETEFSSGIEQISSIARELLEGEHFQATVPVLKRLPVQEFKLRLNGLYTRIEAVLAEAEAVAEPAKA